MEKRVKQVVFSDQTLVLKDVILRCNERGFVVMDTQKRDYNVWIFDTSIEQKDFFFVNQRNALAQLRQNGNVIDLHDVIEIDEITKCLITERVDNCSLGSIISSETLIDYEILIIGVAVAEIIQELHDSHKIANFINPEYIFPRKRGYKALNFTLTIDKEQLEINHNRLLSSNIFTENRTFKPTGYSDNLQPEDDIRNFGLLLYQMAYGNLEILYNKGNKVAFPDKPSHSYVILNTIDACLNSKKHERPNIAQIIQDFRNEQKLDLPENCGSNDSTIMANINLHEISQREKTLNSSDVKSGAKSSWGLFISKTTTHTEGWFRSYVEGKLEMPDEGLVNKVLEKAWRKREKVNKLLDIVNKFTDDSTNMRHPIVVLKVLMFLHSYMYKGPPQVITCAVSDKIKSLKTEASEEAVSLIDYIIRKIKFAWEEISKNYLKEKLDNSCTHAVAYFIYFYSITLSEKARFGFFYSSVVAGNFSVEPLHRTQDVSTLFNLQLFRDSYVYCSTVLLFLTSISKDFGLRIFQIPIIKHCINEVRAVLGCFCHFVSTYKKVSYTFVAADRPFLDQVVDEMEKFLEAIIIRFYGAIENLKHSEVFRMISDTLPTVALNTIEEIRQITPNTLPLQQFNVEEFIPIDGCFGDYCIEKPYGTEATGRNISHQEKLLLISREVDKEIKGIQKLSTSQSKSHYFQFRGIPKMDAPNFSMKPKIVMSEQVRDKSRPGLIRRPAPRAGRSRGPPTRRPASQESLLFPRRESEPLPQSRRRCRPRRAPRPQPEPHPQEPVTIAWNQKPFS